MSNDPKKRLIQLTKDGLEQLQRERMAGIDAHLQELGKHASIRNQDVDTVVRAALEHHGLPRNAEDRRVFLDACADLADSLTSRKLSLFHEEMKALLAELNVHDAPAHVKWAAKHAGVVLFPDDDAPASAPADGEKAH